MGNLCGFLQFVVNLTLKKKKKKKTPPKKKEKNILQVQDSLTNPHEGPPWP